ncbi:dethiobiotin synthase [Enterobacterales bacterium CwR94]|nr:dethiobiotin synthase [Enterobacterales bacterium CwR94]
MTKCFFVTGTDTEVGKTVVSLALLQKFAEAGQRVAGYKPVAKGSRMTEHGPRNQDALLLQAHSSAEWTYAQINPVTLVEDEISLNRDTCIDHQALQSGLVTLAEQSDCVIVEGSGGWRTLLNDGKPLSDWAIAQQLPVILVVGIKPGCVSHALLTAETVIADGLKLAGWVANRINPGLPHYAEIIHALQEKIPAPLLGELPYLPRAAERDLRGYIDISAL